MNSKSASETSTRASGQTAASIRRVDQLLAHYGQSHRHPVNEVIHFIAIPLIMFSLVGLLFLLHPYVAYGFLAASMVYYARLSMAFFITMMVGSLLMLALIQRIGPSLLPLCVTVFVGAWVMQFIGHKLEGKKPSFMEDIQYLWVGPLFVLSKLFERLGLRW